MKLQSGCNAKRNGDPRSACSRRLAPVLAAAAVGLVTLTDVRPVAAATITVDASVQTAGNPHFWSASFGTGKAKLTLRADLQTHYKIANRELGAQRVRGHGLLNDEMALYRGQGSYDWTNLDTYLTAITSANMRPIMELDFMPTALGTIGAKSPPNDYDEWKSFIQALAQHCVDTYGADDVGNWYFEVWNEPDYSAFWTADMPAYYTLYDNTVAALAAVLPDVLVGGPGATWNGPIAAFLQHCKTTGTRVTFVSSHSYPGGNGSTTSSTHADAAQIVSDNKGRISAITSTGYTTADVKSFNTEWNSSYSGQGGGTGDSVTSMDNHWNVGFILKAVKLLSDGNLGDTPPLEVFSYWVLSDVFDETGGPDGSYIAGQNNGNLPFGAVFGAMTYQGMRKAAFNAFKMLNYLGSKRLQSAGGTDSADGVDAMATMSDAGDELQVLVYNYYKTLNTAVPPETVKVEVSNLPSALANREVFVTQFLVDETHSNPYNVWVGQSKPGNPTEDQWQEMRKAQHLALMQPVAKSTVNTSFLTSFPLNPQAGTLIIIGTKRPLVGRNALVEIEGEDYDGQSGVTKEDSGDSTLGQSISMAGSGAYVYFENVDYTDNGVASVELRVKTESDTALELHQDSVSGALLANCSVSSTSSTWVTQTCKLSQTATGVSGLYVVSGGAAHLNWVKFVGPNPPPINNATPGAPASSGCSCRIGNAGGRFGALPILGLVVAVLRGFRSWVRRDRAHGGVGGARARRPDSPGNRRLTRAVDPSGK